jgi:hypothetical protein
MDLEQATIATFTPHRGTAFRVVANPDSGSTSVDLRLTDIERLPGQPGGPRAEPFALHFSGPPQPLLEQRTYRLGHEQLSELEIFLVPIAYGADGGLIYEAVFN